MPTYTGVGSTQLPEEWEPKLRWIGQRLARAGYTLRSGRAKGADTAFETGCDIEKGRKEIFLPYDVPDWAYEMVQEFVPLTYDWRSFKEFTKTLLARDMQQVLGRDGDSPSEFLVCYVREGAKYCGGTGYAIRCARYHTIPVYNLRHESACERFKAEILSKLK
jgi:hypothetical protein